MEASLVSLLAVSYAALHNLLSDSADLFFTKPIPVALHFVSSSLRH